MRNFNENTITNAVLDRISGAGDPRVRQISEALVRHLHAFARGAPDPEGMGVRYRLPHAHRAEVR
jgi:hypothetical protein